MLLFKSAKYTVIVVLHSTEELWISLVGLKVVHVPFILQALMIGMQTATAFMPRPSLKKKVLASAEPMPDKERLGSAFSKKRLLSLTGGEKSMTRSSDLNTM